MYTNDRNLLHFEQRNCFKIRGAKERNQFFKFVERKKGDPNFFQNPKKGTKAVHSVTTFAYEQDKVYIGPRDTLFNKNFE